MTTSGSREGLRHWDSCTSTPVPSRERRSLEHGACLTRKHAPADYYYYYCYYYETGSSNCFTHERERVGCTSMVYPPHARASKLHGFSWLSLCEANRNTWFTVEGLKQCVQYLNGVATGTSLADVVFCIGRPAVLEPWRKASKLCKRA